MSRFAPSRRGSNPLRPRSRTPVGPSGLAALALGLALAACGDSDDDSADTAAPTETEAAADVGGVRQPEFPGGARGAQDLHRRDQAQLDLGQAEAGGLCRDGDVAAGDQADAAARAAEDALRTMDADDADLINHSPLLAYVSPGRFATIDRSNAFPFPESMKK